MSEINPYVFIAGASLVFSTLLVLVNKYIKYRQRLDLVERLLTKLKASWFFQNQDQTLFEKQRLDLVSQTLFETYTHLCSQFDQQLLIVQAEKKNVQTANKVLPNVKECAYLVVYGHNNVVKNTTERLISKPSPSVRTPNMGITNKYDYTIVDESNHSNFVKNMITGATKAAGGLIIMPANTGKFEAQISKNSAFRQHIRFLNLIGIKSLIIGVDNMNNTETPYSQSRFDEICKETKALIKNLGWISESVVIVPMSSETGDNLIVESTSTQMLWWKGQEIDVNRTKATVHTLLDALDNIQNHER